MRNAFKSSGNEERVGVESTPATPMKFVRSRRGTTAAASGQRHIFTIGAGTKVRSVLAQLAAAWPDAAWQEFNAGHDFLRLARELGTGCVVVFDPLHDIETLAVVSWLGQQRPDIASIVVASNPTVKAAVDCLKAGATDYLGMPLDQLAAAAALKAVFEPGPERPTRGSALARLNMTSRLSQRELQVLDGLLTGMSNKEVGAKLHISERTVEVHRSRIMRRLDVASFAQLVRMSAQAGLASG